MRLILTMLTVFARATLTRTKSWAPSRRFPGEPGWYWHEGDKSGASEDEFTIASLIAEGR